MNSNLEQARLFIEKYGIGRDSFINIISIFQADEDKQTITYWYKDKNLYVDREYWMNDVSNKRKLYEEVIGIKTKELIEEELISNADGLTDLALMKQVQVLRDKNVKLNKVIRENFRNISKTEDILCEIKESIPVLDLSNITDNANVHFSGGTRVGILQLSDLHLNEIINESNNIFDFNVASRRLHYFVNRAKEHFLDNAVDTVYILGTGDFINSNRRDSEKVNSSTSRVRASMIAVKLISMVIADLLTDFDVKVSFVSSNESRIEKDCELDDLSASENFDIIIYNMLKMMFNNTDYVHFIDCNMVEGVVQIDEIKRTILLTHGTQFGTQDLQKKVQELKGKYASRGVLIDYVFSGNIHSCLISDKFSRSASLCGGNGFSDSMLGFDSRASQNCYIMYNDGAVDGLKIDLQTVGGYGYDISKELEEFSVKTIIR
jgi:hypothetical protein